MGTLIIFLATTTTATTATTATTQTSESTTTTAPATAAPTSVATTVASETMTTTTAIVTTTVIAEGTTTTKICEMEDLMGDDSMIPLRSVQTLLGSSEEYQPYDEVSRTWKLSVPHGDEKPSMVFKFLRPSQVGGIRMNPDSGVKTVDVYTTDDKGETTPFENALVTSDGRVALPSQISVIESVTEMKVVFVEPADEKTSVYRPSVNALGCYKEATTTIVAPSTTTIGEAMPSTTTTITSEAAETVPTTTTTLSTTPGATEVGTTTTVAVVTTTTTPTGSTIVVCPLSDKMPSQAPEFGDNQFTVLSGGGNPSDVQPGRTGWKPAVPPKGSQPPEMRIIVPPTTNNRPSLIASVTIEDDSLSRVTVVFIFKGVTVYTITEILPPSGSVTVGPKGLPVEVDEITVRLDTPTNQDVKYYDTKATLTGCFEPAAGELNFAIVGLNGMLQDTFESLFDFI